MILVCPECANPYELPNGQIAALVQVACPHCTFAVIYDFEAANQPELRETGTGLAQACWDRASYIHALGQNQVAQPRVAPAARAQPHLVESKPTLPADHARSQPSARTSPPYQPSARISQSAKFADASRGAPSPAAENDQPGATAANDAAGKNPAANDPSAHPAAAQHRSSANLSPQAADVEHRPSNVDSPRAPLASPSERKAPLLSKLTPRPGNLAASATTPEKREPTPAPSDTAPPPASSWQDLAPPSRSFESAESQRPGRATLAPPSSFERADDSRPPPPKTIQFSTDALTSFIAAQKPEFAAVRAEIEPAAAEPIELRNRLDTQPEISIRPHPYEGALSADALDTFDEPFADRNASPAEPNEPDEPDELESENDRDDSESPFASTPYIEPPAARDQGAAKSRAPAHSPAAAPASLAPQKSRDDTDLGLYGDLDERPTRSWGKRIVVMIGLLLLICGVTTSVMAYLQTGSFDPIPFVQTLAGQ
jgi:hypothetical protein